VSRTLDDHRSLFESLAQSLGSTGSSTSGPGEGDDHPAVADPTSLDPLDEDAAASAWLGQLMGMIQPMTLGMAAGSMVGHLSTRSFGQYDLPVPRPPGDQVMVLVPAIDAFAEEWSLGVDDVRLWVCLHEVAHHAVLGVPHVRAAMTGLIERFVAGFRPDPGGFERALTDLDPSDPSGMEAVQRMFTDPEVLMGATSSPAQDEVRPPAGDAGRRHRGLGRPHHGSGRREPRRELRPGHRGRPPSPGRDQPGRPLRRAAVRAQPHPGPHRPRLGVRRRCRRAGRRGGPGPPVGQAGRPPTPAELAAPGLWLARIDL
jgi:hypothetical protein